MLPTFSPAGQPKPFPICLTPRRSGRHRPRNRKTAVQAEQTLPVKRRTRRIISKVTLAMVTPLFNAMQNQSATAPTKNLAGVYDVAGWRRDETGTAIKSLAAEFARELYQSALIEAATKEPEIGKRIIFKRGGTGNKKRIDPALSFAACIPSGSGRAVPIADPFLVGVQNGAL